MRPLLDHEGAGPIGMVRPVAPVRLDEPARHNVADGVGKLVEDDGGGLGERDLDRACPDRLDAAHRCGLLRRHVRSAHDSAEVVLRGARGKSGAERAIERPDDVLCGQRRSVGELQARPQREGVRLAVAADRPRRGAV